MAISLKIAGIIHLFLKDFLAVTIKNRPVLRLFIPDRAVSQAIVTSQPCLEHAIIFKSVRLAIGKKSALG